MVFLNIDGNSMFCPISYRFFICLQEWVKSKQMKISMRKQLLHMNINDHSGKKIQLRTPSFVIKVPLCYSNGFLSIKN